MMNSNIVNKESKMYDQYTFDIPIAAFNEHFGDISQTCRLESESEAVNLGDYLSTDLRPYSSVCAIVNMLYTDKVLHTFIKKFKNITRFNLITLFTALDSVGSGASGECDSMYVKKCCVCIFKFQANLSVILYEDIVSSRTAQGCEIYFECTLFRILMCRDVLTRNMNDFYDIFEKVLLEKYESTSESKCRMLSYPIRNFIIMFNNELYTEGLLAQTLVNYDGVRKRLHVLDHLLRLVKRVFQTQPCAGCDECTGDILAEYNSIMFESKCFKDFVRNSMLRFMIPFGVNLSEKFMDTWSEYIDFHAVSLKQRVSREFIDRHRSKLCSHLLSMNSKCEFRICTESQHGASDEEAKPKYADEKCPICREKLEAEQRACEPHEGSDATADDVVTNMCGHAFHRGCLVSWTKISRTCPMCRSPADLREVLCMNECAYLDIFDHKKIYLLE